MRSLFFSFERAMARQCETEPKCKTLDTSGPLICRRIQHSQAGEACLQQQPSNAITRSLRLLLAQVLNHNDDAHLAWCHHGFFLK